MVKSLFANPVAIASDNHAGGVMASSANQMANYASTAVALKPISINEIAQLGSKASATIPAATSKITSMAKAGEMDEVGKLLLDTLEVARGYDPDTMKQKGFFSRLFGKAVSLKDKFDSVDQNVDALVRQLQLKAALFKGRIGDLDQIKNQLRLDYDQLALEIADIIARCDWMDANPPSVDPNDPMQANILQDWKMAATMGRKRADDLARLRLLFEQQAAQVDQMKINSAGLAQKMVDLQTTTIPALKSTFALYIINVEQEQGAKLTTTVDDATNLAIQKNAKKIGQNTTAIHTSLTRSNLDLETLKVNHQAILDSLSEMSRIHSEAKLRLQNEAPQLEQLSRELAVALANPAH